jgi:phosphonate transport system ATP-binding protein
MLSMRQLSKHFGMTIAVDDITLEIPTGQMVGVIGRSGAGKSTLLRLVNRLLDPTRGAIHFKNIAITDLQGRELRAWRRRCAMIFQQFNLVNRLDVITNVLMGRLSYHWKIPSLVKRFTSAERALSLRALERLDMLPQALQRADTLSGGQQQRVAIARALVQEPEIILADEPIASLRRTIPQAFGRPWRERLAIWLGWAVFAALVALCLWRMEVSPERLWHGLGKLGWLLKFMFPPSSGGWLGEFAYAML